MANRKCDCHQLADPDSMGTIGSMARAANKVIGGRVTNDTARAVAQYCSTHNCSQSTALRKALALLSSTSDDPEAALEALRELLNLDPAASQEDAVAAVQALFDAANAPNGPGDDGLQETVDQSPAPLFGASSPPAVKARVSPGALARVRAIATHQHSTVSIVLQQTLEMLASAGTTAPTPKQLKALDALLAALGLSPDAGQAEAVAAITSLMQSAAAANTPSAVGGFTIDPGPKGPVRQLTDAAPSARETFDAKKAGLTVPELRAAKLRLLRRTPSKTKATRQ